MDPITLSEVERQELNQWISSDGVPAHVVARSRLILAISQGQSKTAIWKQLRVRGRDISVWHSRFERERLKALWELSPAHGPKRWTPHLSESDQRQMESWMAAIGTPSEVALRCAILLGAAQGEPNLALARRLNVNRDTIALWLRRFKNEGLNCLWNHGRGRGRKPIYGPTKVKAIDKATLRTSRKGTPLSSIAQIAHRQRVSHTTVYTIAENHHRRPHRMKPPNLSPHTEFLTQLTDVVGLYLNPPHQVVVLCIDERNQVRTLNQWSLSSPRQQTSDFRPSEEIGYSDLLPGLQVLQQLVRGDHYARGRIREFLRFLRRLDREFPVEVPLYLLIDRYGMHDLQQVRVWLKHHPRFVLHVVDPDASWLNCVERWIHALSNIGIRCARFPSIPELVEAMGGFLSVSSEKPRPFVWSTTVESIAKRMTPLDRNSSNQIRDLLLRQA